jgi:hypothetical protein
MAIIYFSRVWEVFNKPSVFRTGIDELYLASFWGIAIIVVLVVWYYIDTRNR